MTDDIHHPTNRQPWHAYLGWAILVLGQIAYVFNLRLVEVWLTPTMWTGFILAADGLVFMLRGESWLTRRRKSFAFLCIVSVGVWLVFEAYNFHLQNWLYRGVPKIPFWRDVAYFWSFATIMPAVFQSAELVMGVLEFLKWNKGAGGQHKTFGPLWMWFAIGLAMVTIPLAVPLPWSRYLFGFVWLGWIPLLDTINHMLGLPSFFLKWQHGDWKRTVGLLVGGFICGLLWESWNYQAALANGGHWIYTIPDLLRPFDLHFGKMPLLGLLGFPPFAMELWAFYLFLHKMFSGGRIFEEIPD
jgi:hypothetical protein